MQIRRACSRDYYCLRETVIAGKMKRSFISPHHSLSANLQANQLAAIETSKAGKISFVRGHLSPENLGMVQL